MLFTAIFMHQSIKEYSAVDYLPLVVIANVIEF